ncbi:Uncharacterised protein [Acinetobacter baumannii]|nr:Uncharacterised protein [Acinetobacter baumannii]
MNAGIRKLPLTLILLLLAAAGGLTIYNLMQQLSPAQWARALRAPDIDDVRCRCWPAPVWDWSVCCSSRCCATRWQSRRRSAWPPARSSA